MKKGILLVVVCLMIVVGLGACGGGGGGVADPAPAWTGPVNSSGFPLVAGTYAATSQPYTLTCSNGNSSTVPASSSNFTVTQSQNTITLTSNAPILAGVTVKSQTDPAGTVGKDASFVATGSVVMNMNGIAGDIDGISSYSGQFTTTSWAGQVKITLLYTGLGQSCTGTLQFNGSKL